MVLVKCLSDTKEDAKDEDQTGLYTVLAKASGKIDAPAEAEEDSDQ